MRRSEQDANLPDLEVSALKREIENLKIKLHDTEKSRDEIDTRYRALVANATALLIEKREFCEATSVRVTFKSEARIEKALQVFRDRETLSLPFS